MMVPNRHTRHTDFSFYMYIYTVYIHIYIYIYKSYSQNTAMRKLSNVLSFIDLRRPTYSQQAFGSTVYKAVAKGVLGGAIAPLKFWGNQKRVFQSGVVQAIRIIGLNA